MTRETERGTMESLLAMPITPFEIMLGKIAPYVLVGFVQAALILGAGVACSACRSSATSRLLAALTTLFIATNLSFGYTFSTLAQNQLQAVQMSMMFFLPNMLLSGFIFPFLGMPRWAQYDRRVPAADAFHPHRARDHAQRRDAFAVAIRHAGARRSDGAGDGDCRHAFPPHAGLIAAPAALRSAETRKPKRSTGAVQQPRVAFVRNATFERVMSGTGGSARCLSSWLPDDGNEK